MQLDEQTADARARWMEKPHHNDPGNIYDTPTSSPIFGPVTNDTGRLV